MKPVNVIGIKLNPLKKEKIAKDRRNHLKKQREGKAAYARILAQAPK